MSNTLPGDDTSHWRARRSANRQRSVLGCPPVAVLSSFPPRECGIATFAGDLIMAIESMSCLRDLADISSIHPWVIAMHEPGQTYAYDHHVHWTIDRDNREAYRRAAEYINCSRLQLVSIQHEYGLFGGDYGEYLLDFLGAVRRPIVLTMHTVLERPDAGLRRLTERLINRSAAVVVLAKSAQEILAAYYGNAQLCRVTHIPHGTPVVRREPAERYKYALGLDGHTILSTFGLLGPDKGIEDAIRALPEVVARHPDVVYLVLGETHPAQRRHAGESYRETLHTLVAELGLCGHVRFVNRYLSLAELVHFVQATDIFIMPYLNSLQTVSGTLSYAVACGKAVVATPFVYAREMLSDQRGILADLHCPESIARAVNALLDDPELKELIESRAYAHGLRMHWPVVGKRYLQLFGRVVDDP